MDTIIRLDRLMELDYVKEKLGLGQKKRIMNNYKNAPYKVKQKLVEKIERLNEMYMEYKLESNLQKRTLILFKMMKEQIKGIKSKMQKKKFTLLALREETETKITLKKLDEQLKTIKN